MFEKVLHGGNIAAAFGVVATTADLTFAGGAATAMTVALSGTAIYKGADSQTKALATKIAAQMEQAFAQSHLTDERRRVVIQMIGTYQPSNEDIVGADLDATAIGVLLSHRAKTDATDPAHRTETALDDFRAIIAATLTPILEDPAIANELQLTITKELLARTKTSGQQERLLEEGITEKAIIRLAQRYASGTEDVGQAWLELQNAMDVAVRVQQDGRVTSNHGDFVDEVIRRVAELAADGAYDDANARITAALEDEDAAHVARKSRLLESGIKIARLDNQPELLADRLVAKLQLDASPDGLFNALRLLRREWYERGRDGGLNFEAHVAVHLAKECIGLAQDADHRGMALNDLGLALWTLGARESGTARLEQAVATYRAALDVRTRETVPLDWAITQNNLGNVLKNLGERESETTRLEEAVAAYRAALEERTRETLPLEWALTQNNLGTALKTLGERESGTARLEEAVAAYRAALEERTRETVPLKWALTQNNLGTALSTLGERESGTARLEEAVQAFRAALEEWTRDTVPLNWAMTQNNLGNTLRTLGARESGTARLDAAVAAFRAALEEWKRETVPLDWAGMHLNLCAVELAFFDKTGDVAHLDRAQGYVDAAKVVFDEAGADYYSGMADELIAAIAARRAG